MKKTPFHTASKVFAIAAGALLAGVFLSFAFEAFAFNGPSANPPSGSGAIGSDSSNNVAVGTSTTISGTKFLILGATNDASTYASKIESSNQTPILFLRDDGAISIVTSTMIANTTLVGENLTVTGIFTANTYSGSVSAGNVSAGTFGSNYGGGGYSFPSTLTVNSTGAAAASGVTEEVEGSSGGDANLVLQSNGGSGSAYWISAPNANNILAIGGTGGTEPASGAINITNTGKVGIGTTNPQASFDVGGNITSLGGGLSQSVADYSTNFNGASGVQFQNTNTGTGADFRFELQDPSSTTYLANFMPGAGNTAALFGLSRSAQTGVFENAVSGSGRTMVLGTVNNDSLILGTNNNARMTILGGGNVGVGTTTPGYPLSVNGQVNATGYCISGANCISAWPSGGGGTVTSIVAGTGLSGGTITSSGTISLNLGSANTWTAAQTFNAATNFPGSGVWNTSGEVGIGTPSPGRPLVVSGIADVGQLFTTGNNTYNTSSPTAADIVIGSNEGTRHDSSIMLWSAGSADRLLDHNDSMYLSAWSADALTGANVILGAAGGANYFAGSVGIGISSPGDKLQVVGTAAFGQNTNGTAIVDAYGGDAYFGDNGSGASYGISINSSGSVGIGTTGPNAKLDVAGKILAAEGSGTSGGYSFENDGSWDTGMFSPSDGVLDFYDNGNHSLDFGTGGIMTVYQTSTFNGNVSVSGKLTVGTIDPVYAINGQDYATYNPAMTGEKEETTGLLTLACAKPAVRAAAGACSTTIDFSALPQGSDLWLFGKATDLPGNLDNLIVILTPSFNGNVWYTKDSGAGTLTVHGDQAGEVSYRLSAPRFDASQWPNTAPSGETPNFTIN